MSFVDTPALLRERAFDGDLDLLRTSRIVWSLSDEDELD